MSLPPHPHVASEIKIALQKIHNKEGGSPRPLVDAPSLDDLLGAVRSRNDAPRGTSLLTMIVGKRGLKARGPRQARLRLESLHPGRHGILDAYATPFEAPTRR